MKQTADLVVRLIHSSLRRGLFVALACTLHTGSAASIPIESLAGTGTGFGTAGTPGGSVTGLDNMIDGSYQATSYQQFTGPASVTMDMGSLQTVDRLVVVGQFTTGVKTVTAGTIQVSSDGNTWSTVSTFNNPNAGGGTTLALGFGAVEARYVRLNVTSTTGTEAISELRLYNGSGPRISIVDRGANFNLGTADRVPFNLVDNNQATFGLWSTGTGDFTARLDSVEYSEGWSGLRLTGKSYPSNPSNPGILTITAGNDLSSMETIYSQANSWATTNFAYDITFDETYHYTYIKVAWVTNPLWDVAGQNNVQLLEFDVLPIPEASTVGLMSAGLLLAAGSLIRRRKHTPTNR